MNNDIFYLKELSEAQKTAVTINSNATISAGAGSGKTRVLTKRFVYLILERKIPIEKILALTFTKKAANEMRNRIYNELCKVKDLLKNKTKKDLAQTAVDNFSNANILTLDSFCSKVARNGCKEFGISPDFTIDQNRSNKIANECSLNFFMRKNHNLYKLISSTDMENFITSFFESFLNYVTLTKLVDINADKFDNNLEELFEKYINDFKNNRSIVLNFDDSKKEDALLSPLKDKLNSISKFPKYFSDKSYEDFRKQLDFCLALNFLRGSKKIPEVLDAREAAKKLRQTSNNFILLENTYANRNLMLYCFELLNELQKEFINKKIAEGVLNYADVAQLAVDALQNNIDLRNFYKNAYDSIMIDEFQDNNKLQRNLLFLISEKKELCSENIPEPTELIENKLFFVGDDKQSIYLFRGADVSVFKTLTENFASYESPSLNTNYRSEPELINFFNELFVNVFQVDEAPDSNLYEELIKHEATFSKISSLKKVKGVKPSINIFIAHNKENDGDVNLSKEDAEAYTLVSKILEMVNNGVAIRDDNCVRPCKFSDFAILFRTTTNQNTVEKYLRLAGIPYQTVQQKGIFYDAPINDLLAIIKLALHPDDKFIYAQVLRSPFSRLDDAEITNLFLENDKSNNNLVQEPFTVLEKNKFTKETIEKLKSLHELFLRVKNYLIENTCAEVISKLWYNEGYRYLILQNENYKRYMELYDYLFEIARQCDAEKISMEGFLQLIDSYSSEDKRLDDMEIPLDNFENDNTVKLLTIHKSKGLEFKIVCLPYCASEKQPIRLNKRVLYSEKYGITISLADFSDENNAKDKNTNQNIFFIEEKDLANKKEIAELKRLLYVALTRAECHIIMTGIKASRGETKNFLNLETDELIQKMQECYSPLKNKGENKTTISFYDLLVPHLPKLLKNTANCLTIQEILPIPFDKKIPQLKIANRKNSDTNNFNKLKFISQCKIKTFKNAPPKFLAASHLTDEAFAENIQNKNFSEISENFEKSNFLKTTQLETLTAAELGILAHAAIEAKFNNKEIILPKTAKTQISNWSKNFFDSPLGQKALSAKKRKIEYGFILKSKGKTILGKSDLIFEHNEILYIVDYKTDKTENKNLYVEQLSVYKTACIKLFNKRPENVKAYLFFLRSGTALEV